MEFIPAAYEPDVPSDGQVTGPMALQVLLPGNDGAFNRLSGFEQDFSHESHVALVLADNSGAGPSPA